MSDFDYETDRARWIAAEGSRRLRLAAERGYKHDGIYRDERAAKDAPGFVALPHAKVGEVVNPTADALELESMMLDQFGGAVRIVWVKDSGCDLPDGEYVMLAGFLGKHTLYRPVHEEDA